jgi:hypothetical protein
MYSVRFQLDAGYGLPRRPLQLDVCDIKKHLRADLVEPLVWEGVSEVLGEPERLRRGLQRMLEKEKEASAVDLEGEARIWQEKLSEIKSKRANFQELTAEGLMTKEELRSKLDNLEVARETAERELRLARERSERRSGGTPKTSWRPTRRGASRPWKTSHPKSGERCTSC